MGLASSKRELLQDKGNRNMLEGMTKGARLVPESMFSQRSRMVVDASHVQTVEHEGLELVPINEVFSDPDAVFLGFGNPNVYLALPNSVDRASEPRWDKFAASMFWRKPSYIANTKGRVQGGVLLQLQNLDSETIKNIRSAMESQVGKRTITCANANATVLEAAGFSSGSKSLSRGIRPSNLASQIWENGLEVNGQPVELRFIRTAGLSTTDHFAAVLKKEATSFGRLAKKVYNSRKPNPAPLLEPRMLDGLRNTSDEDAPTLALSVGRPSKVGALISSYWGNHPIFEATPIDPLLNFDSSEFRELNTALPAYPGKLDLVTKLKKAVLFSRPVVKLIRQQMAKGMDDMGSFPGPSLANMLQVDTEEAAFMYNAVLTGSSLSIARLENRTYKDKKLPNWVLTKHVLVANYDPDVRFAGEFWVTDSDEGRVVHINNNSGTYKPSIERAQAAARFVEQVIGVKAKVHEA